MTDFQTTLRQASEYLSAHDPVLAPVIARSGPCTIAPHTNYYWELVDSIISQQLSVKAAASIERRFQELFGTEDVYKRQELVGEQNVREVVAFPKNGSGIDTMMNSPSVVDEQQLKELHLNVNLKD